MYTYRNTPENAKNIGWALLPEHVFGSPTSRYVLHNTVKGEFHYTNDPGNLVEQPAREGYRWVQNLMSGKYVEEAIDTPYFCSVGSESYWSS
jgi:hypothetical protein